MTDPNSIFFVKPSQRLRYRLLSLSDIELLWEVDQDPEVMQYINGGQPTSRQEIEEVFIPRLAAYRNERAGWGLWQLSLSADNSYIGWILIRPMDFFSGNFDVNHIELGWRLKKKAWGHGYASEGVRAITKTLWQTTSVESVWAVADKENTRSIAVMKRLGMSYVKTGIHRDPLGDHPVDYFCLKRNLGSHYA